MFHFGIVRESRKDEILHKPNHFFLSLLDFILILFFFEVKTKPFFSCSSFFARKLNLKKKLKKTR